MASVSQPVARLAGELAEVPKSVLEGLTDKQRFVLEMRTGARDGYTYTQREIAELMGVSTQAVFNLEHAALKKIKKAEKRWAA